MKLDFLETIIIISIGLTKSIMLRSMKRSTISIAENTGGKLRKIIQLRCD